MTLADKRKVIEVLLCCGQDPCASQLRETTGGTARALEVERSVDTEAHRQWLSVRRESMLALPHGDLCITAAYRLIESSPTLRREWFGAR